MRNFTIDDGTLIYETAGAPASATVNAINLKLRDFVFNAPFTVAVTFAALSDQQNFDLSATIGPLVSNGVLDIDAIPVTGTAKVGPIQLTQLETIPMLAKAIPPKLSISGPVSFDATADGTMQSIKFTASSDLSASAVAFGDTFNKPADTPLKISAEGSRTDSAVAMTLANVTLGDLEAKATDIKVGGGTTAAHVDTNSFDIASIAKMIPAIAKYNPDRQDRDSFRRDVRQGQGVGRRYGRSGGRRLVDSRAESAAAEQYQRQRHARGHQRRRRAADVQPRAAAGDVEGAHRSVSAAGDELRAQCGGGSSGRSRAVAAARRSDQPALRQGCGVDWIDDRTDRRF